ncbi:MAG: Dipeptidyl aminopeptidase BIII [Candidatus Omnitrophica bacterium]|nr:Dipeptidyl aminopeptidase BIII [Candidatus Omnitrophota bacterium]
MNTAVKAVEDVEIIPKDVLFGNPVKAAPTLSPDGRHLAYLAPDEGVLNVWVGPADGSGAKPVTRDRERGIRNYFWSEDSRYVMYQQDQGGNENWRLYAVDLRDGATRDLTPYEGVQVRVVDIHKDRPDEILFSMNKENPQHHDVYRLYLSNGKTELIAKNPGHFAGWMTDADSKVRAALAITEDGGEELLVRDTESSPWRSIVKWTQDDSSSSGPIAFTKDGRSMYVRDARDYNSGRLGLLDLTTGKFRVIAQDPQYDIAGVQLHPDTRVLELYAIEKDRPHLVVQDPSIQPDVDALKKLHDGDFFINSRTHADDMWVVGYHDDDGPMPYYVYDRKSRQAKFIFHNRPDLSRYRLAPMEPFEYKTRDGLTVHGYLSFPPGKPRKNLPTVLNVHGGPWVRDTWGYDAEAQWLANRGYLCVQVNYRGSSGYGKDFVNAGDKEWGGRMHDDLVDAVKHIIDKGYADPKRVAIYGGSYGGYAALVGATFTPELFACAVDIVGPSNLLTFIRSVPPYWEVYLSQFYRRVGNPETEEAFLRERSPLFRVDNIRKPLLIAQGANDPRVKQAESEQIVAALREKGIDHEYMLFPDEGHGFAKPDNRIKFYTHAERFLAKHLGGRAEA